MALADLDRESAAKSNAERSRKFRRLRRTREWAVAVAVARLTTGRDPEDLGKAVADWLDDVAKRTEGAVPDIEVDSIEEIRMAATKLRRRR